MNLCAFVVISCVFIKEIYSADNQTKASSSSSTQGTAPPALTSSSSTLTEIDALKDPTVLDTIDHLETGVSDNPEQEEEKRLRTLRNQKRKEQKKNKKAAQLIKEKEIEEQNTLLFLPGISFLKKSEVPEFFQKFSEDISRNELPPEGTRTSKETTSVDDEDPSETSSVLLDPEEMRKRAIRNQKRKEQRKRKKVSSKATPLLQDETSTSIMEPDLQGETGTSIIEPDEHIEEVHHQLNESVEMISNELGGRAPPTGEDGHKKQNQLNIIHSLFPGVKIIRKSEMPKLLQKLSEEKSGTEQSQTEKDKGLSQMTRESPGNVLQVELLEKISGIEPSPSQSKKEKGLPEITSESPSNVSHMKLLEEISKIEPNYEKESGLPKTIKESPDSVSRVELLEEMSEIESGPSEKKKGLSETTSESPGTVSEVELEKNSTIELSKFKIKNSLSETTESSSRQVFQTPLDNDPKNFKDDKSSEYSMDLIESSQEQGEEFDSKKSKKKKSKKNKKKTSKDSDITKLPPIEEGVPQKSDEHITQLQMIGDEPKEGTNVGDPPEIYLHLQKEIDTSTHSSQINNVHRESREEKELKLPSEFVPNIDESSPNKPTEILDVESYNLFESSKKKDIPNLEEDENERVFEHKIILQREASVLPTSKTPPKKSEEEIYIEKPLTDTIEVFQKESSIASLKNTEEEIQGFISNAAENEVITSKSDSAILPGVFQKLVVPQSDHEVEKAAQSDPSIEEELVVAVESEDKQFQTHYDKTFYEVQDQPILADHLDIDHPQLSNVKESGSTSEGQSTTVEQTESIHSALHQDQDIDPPQLSNILKQSENILEGQKTADQIESMHSEMHSPVISTNEGTQYKKELFSGESSQTLVSTTYKRDDDNNQLASIRKSPSQIDKTDEIIDSLNILSVHEKTSQQDSPRMDQFLSKASTEPPISPIAIQQQYNFKISPKIFIELFPPTKPQDFKSLSSPKDSQIVASQLKHAVKQILYQVLPSVHETILEAVDQHIQEKLAKIFSHLATNYAADKHKSVLEDEKKVPRFHFASPLLNDSKIYELIEEIIEKKSRDYIKHQSNLYTSHTSHQQSDDSRIQPENFEGHTSQIVDTFELLEGEKYFVLITAKSRATNIIEELSNIGINSKSNLGIDRTISYPTTGNILLICSSPKGVVYLQNVLKKSSKLTVLIQTPSPKNSNS